MYTTSIFLGALAIISLVPMYAINMVQQADQKVFTIEEIIPTVLAIAAIIQSILEHMGYTKAAQRVGQASTLINQKAVELIPFIQKLYDHVKTKDLTEEQRKELVAYEMKLQEFNQIAIEHLDLAGQILKPKEQADSLEIDRNEPIVRKKVHVTPQIKPKKETP